MRLMLALLLSLIAAPALARPACLKGDRASTIASAIEAARAVHGVAATLDDPDKAQVLADGVFADQGATAPRVVSIVIVAAPDDSIYLGLIGPDGCFLQVERTTGDRMVAILKGGSA